MSSKFTSQLCGLKKSIPSMHSSWISAHTCYVFTVDLICNVSSLFTRKGTFSPVTVCNQPGTGCKCSNFSFERTLGRTIVMVLLVSIVIIRLPSIVSDTRGLSSDPAKDRVSKTVIRRGLRSSQALPLKLSY